MKPIDPDYFIKRAAVIEALAEWILAQPDPTLWFIVYPHPSGGFVDIGPAYDVERGANTTVQ